jgi:uncharacterized iron-regulated protein
MIRPLWLSSLLLASAPALAVEWLSPRLQDHPLAGVIVDAKGQSVDEARVMAAIGEATTAYIGEKHDNPDHHRLEATLIAARLKARPGSAVVFEMLDEVQAPKLGALAPGDDLDAIRAKLEWPAKGWDLAVYGPLFQQALREGKLVAGNVGKARIGQLYGGGEDLLKDDPRFASVATASPAVRAHLLDSIYEAHCRMQARDSLQPMLAIQLAKDASMADALRRESPALLVAGGEHVRGDSGVPTHAGEAGDRVIVQLLEVREGVEDAKAYFDDAGAADFYWFTPATEARDHCADVKGRAAG